MVTNKDKVILLPRELIKHPETFICPCFVCAQRAYENQARKGSLEEVKQAVEDLLDTTPLSAKTFNIDIISIEQQYPKTLTRYLDFNGQEIVDLNPQIALFEHIYKLTCRFNKQYRHPLVCKLHDICEEISMQITIYRNIYQSEEQQEILLWQYQKIISLISEVIATSKDIQIEDFLKYDLVDQIIVKAKKTKTDSTKILKQRFIKALELQHFHPTSSSDQFQIEYNY